MRGGSRLTACLRQTDTVARLGGDEFALISLGLKHEDDASIIARKAVAELVRPFQLDGQDVYISASVGIAICGADGIEFRALLRQADIALYNAKGSGGRGFGIFQPAMAAEVAARKALERDLRRAFEMEKLELHFQPELDLKSGRLRGAEALLRWRQHDRGWVSPAEMVGVAEVERADHRDRFMGPPGGV